MMFWLLAPCRLVSRCQRLEKHAVSILMAEMEVLGSGGICIGLEEGKAEGLDQSGTRNEGGGSEYTSALKMEILCFSETLESTYESTWRRNPEEQQHHYHFLLRLFRFIFRVHPVIIL
jgi:hypothetical protein